MATRPFSSSHSVRGQTQGVAGYLMVNITSLEVSLGVLLPPP